MIVWTPNGGASYDSCEDRWVAMPTEEALTKLVWFDALDANGLALFWGATQTKTGGPELGGPFAQHVDEGFIAYSYNPFDATWRRETPPEDGFNSAVWTGSAVLTLAW